ncbi:MAG: hypothetical protein JNM00_08975 [Flavobacteriales bacterium]|nr:hypothetical protein [Flavobacteriales bacterium]
MSIKLLFIWLLAGSIAALISCRSMGDSLGQGAVDSFTRQENRDSLDRTVSQLVASTVRILNDSLIDSTIQKRLTALVDSITYHLDSGLHRSFKSLREEEINVLLSDLQQFVKTLPEDVRNGLLNEKTSRWFTDLMSDLVTMAGNEIRAVKDSLLGPTTSAAVMALIDSAVIQLSRSYNTRIKDDIDGIFSRADESVAKAEARAQSLKNKLTWSLVAAGALISGLLVLGRLIYGKQLRNRRLISILTKQINDLPDRSLYDQVTERIAKEAGAKGLLKPLDQMLKEDLAGEKQVWKDKKEQLLKLIGEQLSQPEWAETRQTLLEKARANKLETDMQAFIHNK